MGNDGRARIERRHAAEARFIALDRDDGEPACGKSGERVDGARTTIVQLTQQRVARCNPRADHVDAQTQRADQCGDRRWEKALVVAIDCASAKPAQGVQSFGPGIAQRTAQQSDDGDGPQAHECVRAARAAHFARLRRSRRRRMPCVPLNERQLRNPGLIELPEAQGFHALELVERCSSQRQREIVIARQA